MGNYKKALVIPVLLFCLFVSTVFTGCVTSATDWFEKGYAFQISGKYNEAVDAYTKAIELNPKLAEAYNNRGLAYDESGNHQRAINDYDKAIELNPEYAKAYYNRGNAYGGSGNYQQAIKDYKIAARLGYKPAQEYLKSEGIDW